MNDNGQKCRHWIRLARGIPLASILVLSACSSGAPREFPKASQEDSGATDHATNNVSSVASSATGSGARESSNSTAPVRSEAKSVSAGRSIYFLDSDAALSEENSNVLRQHADYLKQNPKRIIILRAFLDSLGSRSFSLAIVQKRLDLVVQTLREQGIAKSRIRQVMLGQRGKKITCAPPSCQNKGQRIELLYK